MKLRNVIAGLLVGSVAGQVPNRPPSWLMNESTIIMPCNETGFTDPASTKGWSIVDFDWSNAKEIWAKNKPMNDEELLFQQVQMTTSASPETTVWVYRCSVYAYPWYTSVRTILDDPAYAPWFIKFKPGNGTTINPKCDHNYDPPLCSDYFHMQEQTPGYPSGDGNCAAPACDCGSVPCGFYLWNHSSTAVVNNQTFRDWFIHSYMFNTVGSSPLVSGFFWDDFWPGASGNFPDSMPGIVNDTGMSTQDLVSITADYNANMAALQEYTLTQGKFSWQMLWTGGSATGKGSTCPEPLVHNTTCASDLRSLCTASSPAQNRTMMYAFYPGGCKGDPSNLEMFNEDLTNFLLTRGPYAYLGHGWLGCSHFYEYPDALNADYGEPLGLCSETATGSGVFVREFTKSTVQMDCNTYTPTVTFK